MKATTFYFYLTVIICLVVGTISRAIPLDEEEKGKLSRSKRSQTADHEINKLLGTAKVTLGRKLLLARIMDNIDTSDKLPATQSETEVSIPSTTTTEIKSNKSVSGRKHKSKSRGKQEGKRRNNKKSRRNRRRRSKELAQDILRLLESEQGEEILEAIANVVGDDHEFKGDRQKLENFLLESAKKCKCSCKRRSKD